MPLWIKLIVFASFIALLVSLVAWSVVGRAAAHPRRGDWWPAGRRRTTR